MHARSPDLRDIFFQFARLFRRHRIAVLRHWLDIVGQVPNRSRGLASTAYGIVSFGSASASVAARLVARPLSGFCSRSCQSSLHARPSTYTPSWYGRRIFACNCTVTRFSRAGAGYAVRTWLCADTPPRSTAFEHRQLTEAPTVGGHPSMLGVSL